MSANDAKLFHANPRATAAEQALRLAAQLAHQRFYPLPAATGIRRAGSSAVPGVTAVEVDFDTKLVSISGTGLDDAVLVVAIDEAGPRASSSPPMRCGSAVSLPAPRATAELEAPRMAISRRPAAHLSR